ncbi:MAG: squalene/phytoene synthase family protein [Planctomycetaceae bacterium]|jgi:phytoene synthase|nr:squalene/phytoene synthase family protein [Planctomycetaceae bacterium]
MEADFSLSHSIRTCKQLTELAHSNFAPAFALLPSEKCQAMQILYAYTRFTDDLIDLPDFDPKTGQEIPTSVRRKKQKLNQWVSVVEAVLGQIGAEHGFVGSANDVKAFQELAEKYPNCGGLVLLPALKMIVDRFAIPREPLFHLLDGVERDIEAKPFETFDDCSEYCHQVATSVGFASLAIWGTAVPLFSDNVIKAAKACGIAFQWTNIMRDLLEDYQQGRVFLPQNEIQRYALTPNQFGSLLNRQEWNAQKVMPKNINAADKFSFNHYVQEMEALEEKFSKLMAYELNRCEAYYENSVPLYRLIHRDSRRMFGLMWNRYYSLFNTMRKHPLQITSDKRAALSGFSKWRLYFHWRFMPCMNLK